MKNLPENGKKKEISLKGFSKDICRFVSIWSDLPNNRWGTLHPTPSYHGTIAQTGITCKEIPCYMHDSACWWFIVKKAKMFWSYVKHFWILAGVRKCRILTGLCK